MQQYRIKKRFAFHKEIPSKNNTRILLCFKTYYVIQQYTYVDDKRLKHKWKTVLYFINEKKALLTLKKLQK